MKLEISLTAQIDRVSYSDVDFLCHVFVNTFVNTKGNYSPRAIDPSEYYGDQYLEWEYERVDILGEDGDKYLLPPFSEEVEALHDKYGSNIEDIIWQTLIEMQQEEHG